MNKKIGVIFLLLGAVLIAGALSLLLWNRQEDQMAGSQASAALEQMITQMETVPANTTLPPETSPTIPTRPMEMETMTMDGNDYIGYLSIPALELTLPVMAQWSYEKLRVAPCRESGGTSSDDLVIAAHNYDSHFGRLQRLQPGDTVTFTEVDGFLNTYDVESCCILQPDQVEDVLLSGYDLVLYTCTKGGATRVVLYCNRVEASDPA